MDGEDVVLTRNMRHVVACDDLLYRLDNSVYSAGDARHHCKGVRTIKQAMRRCREPVHACSCACGKIPCQKPATAGTALGKGANAATVEGPGEPGPSSFIM